MHVCDVDGDALTAFLARRPDIGGTRADVAAPADVEALFDAVREALGGLDRVADERRAAAERPRPPTKGVSMEKLIITVAGVGAETTREAQPALPVTAVEIGDDAARCREAGASMFHLHVRDAAGNPTQAKEVFAAAIDEIRKRSDIIIQTSTGGAMGMTADERLQPLELDPEMASLTTGTANFGDDVFFNDTALMTEFYTRMQAKGVRPEFEIFEAGQIDNALKLVKKLGPAGPLTCTGTSSSACRAA